jgi:alkylation response protein AidB-like acyl-CoA dehydrogenase
MSSVTALLSRVEQLVPLMQGRAAELDGAAAFPTSDIEQLRAAGVLQAPVPSALGGLGVGTDLGAATDTLALLRLLGRGNLALGRLLEAHINALRLVFRWGDDAIRHRAADDARAGHLFGLWVTDPPQGGLRIDDSGRLDGAKQFCSGANYVTRAVVTAEDTAGRIRLVYATDEIGFSATPLTGGLAGMRAATTGQVRFDQAPASPFGEPGDYLREPDFSCGAWRTSAVTLGGIEALCTQLCAQLVARGRADDPHQQARVGQALIATETAGLWMAAAAPRAEAADGAAADAIAYVGMARLAVERIGFELIELVQRSLGVAALMRTNPVERLCRDLATYLRQPAADMVLTEAAVHGLQAGRPGQ